MPDVGPQFLSTSLEYPYVPYDFKKSMLAEWELDVYRKVKQKNTFHLIQFSRILIDFLYVLSYICIYIKETQGLNSLTNCI